MSDPITPDNVADAGSADALVHGWKRCRTDDERRAWLRTQVATIREGGPELLEAVREAERIRLDPYLDAELLVAERAGDRARMAELLGRRAEAIAQRREAARTRLHEELVRVAVRTATTPDAEGS